MLPGTVLSLHLAPAHGAPLASVSEARAVARRGLEGDRFFKGAPADGTDVTLIEIEAIEAVNRGWDLDLAPGDARRNLVTRGVSLNDLVDRTFRVGGVTLRGLKLCEPCAHLAKLTGKVVVPALTGRGGLRAAIVTGGVIRVGDLVK